VRAALGRARRTLRPVRARCRRMLDRADPARLALPRRDGRPLLVGFACVFRARNSDVVRGVLAGLPKSAAVRLWSLDDVPADLAPMTSGVGRGTRFELLNRLVAEIPPSARSDALVLCDDDVRFLVGDVERLVGLGNRLGFDLFQPAHSHESFASYPAVRKRRLLVARTTRWVEQGPLLVLSPRGQELVLPFPADVGMGWGVDVRWARLAREQGLTLGIVDAVVVEHLVPPASGYDTTEESARIELELARSGVPRITDLHGDLRRHGLLRGWRWAVHRR
jgi:hypothetical protein